MVKLKAVYDQEVNVLRLLSGEKADTSTTLIDDDDVLIEFVHLDGHAITGLAIMGASAYLPLGKRGYDAEADVLVFGIRPDVPGTMQTTNGDLAAFWRYDEADPYGVMDAVGAAVYRASVHLAALQDSALLQN